MLWILRPQPYPALVLLAIISVFFGFMVRPIAIFFWIIAVILIVVFVRGLMIDLSIDREGLEVLGRVTRVEKNCVYFSFTDQTGGIHQQVMPFDEDEEARRFHDGAAVKIRYHPRYPDDVWRWLE